MCVGGREVGGYVYLCKIPNGSQFFTVGSYPTTSWFLSGDYKLFLKGSYTKYFKLYPTISWSMF